MTAGCIIKAAPIDETEAAMDFVLEHDCANGCSRLTEAEFWYDLYTSPTR